MRWLPTCISIMLARRAGWPSKAPTSTYIPKGLPTSLIPIGCGIVLPGSTETIWTGFGGSVARCPRSR